MLYQCESCVSCELKLLLQATHDIIIKATCFAYQPSAPTACCPATSWRWSGVASLQVWPGAQKALAPIFPNALCLASTISERHLLAGLTARHFKSLLSCSPEEDEQYSALAVKTTC